MVKDEREQPIELQIAKFLLDRGIDSIDKIKEFISPSFYAVIPSYILRNQELSANAKLLYLIISSLSKSSGRCFATNNYLAERISLAKESITALLNELMEQKLINIKITKNKKGTYRDIYLNIEGGAWQDSAAGMADERIQKSSKQENIIIRSVDNVDNSESSSNPLYREYCFTDDYKKNKKTFKEWLDERIVANN